MKSRVQSSESPDEEGDIGFGERPPGRMQLWWEMMSNRSPDAGVIQALVERFEKQRLPKALALKEKVDKGALLSDSDVAFLQEVFDDAQYIGPLVAKHPEWQPIAARMMPLYQEITAKALKSADETAESSP